MSMRRSATPELSEAARTRLEALRQDLLREAAPAGRGGVTHPDVPTVPVVAPDAVPGPAVDDPGSSMPIPGRHATSRPRPAPAWLDALADRLPAGLGDRPLGVAHVAVVAVLAAAVIAGGAWWALQVQTDVQPALAGSTTAEVAPASDPSPLVELSGTAPGAPGAPGAGVGVEPQVDPGAAAGAASGAARAGTNALSVVVVDVAGKVRRPGLATLPEGARVADAIEAAGGARRGVSLISLNLARLLVDGEQVLVGVRPPAGVVSPAAPGADGATGPAAAGTGLVNLNTADTPTLETLPGVGPVTAAAIIAWRDEHGGFSSVSELLEVSGIGPATLEELTPHVTV